MLLCSLEIKIILYPEDHLFYPKGYIEKQLSQIEQMEKLERKLLPKNTDYSQIHGLRLEAAEKLNKIQPISIGQASRISGVSPADVSMLVVWLKKEQG